VKSIVNREIVNMVLYQGELAIKNGELAVAAREAEKLLKEISENTAIAEKEKQKVAVIVDQVTRKAQVRAHQHVACSCPPLVCTKAMAECM
jgi:hypothetical protein